MTEISITEEIKQRNLKRHKFSKADFHEGQKLKLQVINGKKTKTISFVVDKMYTNFVKGYLTGNNNPESFMYKCFDDGSVRICECGIN